jgi:hypothetical protein
VSERVRRTIAVVTLALEELDFESELFPESLEVWAMIHVLVGVLVQE